MPKNGDSADLETINWAWKYTNEKILTIAKAKYFQSLIENQNVKWVTHIIRGSNANFTKQPMFPN